MCRAIPSPEAGLAGAPPSPSDRDEKGRPAPVDFTGSFQKSARGTEPGGEHVRVYVLGHSYPERGQSAPGRDPRDPGDGVSPLHPTQRWAEWAWLSGEAAGRKHSAGLEVAPWSGAVRTHQ